MSHVFISYKHDDGHFVDSLREKLKAAEIDSWVDTDIEAGEDWKEKIDTAIEAAFAVVVVLTPESHQSPYVTYEWSYAMGLGKQIVPVLLRKTDRHPKLEAKQYIDFTERQWPEKALVERLHSLKKSYSPSVYSQRSKNAGWEYQHVKDVIDDLDSDDEDIRTAAAITLGELKVIEALEPLIRCLRDPSLGVQIVVTKALGRLKTEKAVPSLVTLVNRKTLDTDFKKELLSALAQIGGKNALDFLRKLHIDEMQNDKDNLATEALLSAINIHGRSVINKSIQKSLAKYVDMHLGMEKLGLNSLHRRIQSLKNSAIATNSKPEERYIDFVIEADQDYIPRIMDRLSFLQSAAHYLGMLGQWLDTRKSLDDLEKLLSAKED